MACAAPSRCAESPVELAHTTPAGTLFSRACPTGLGLTVSGGERWNDAVGGSLSFHGSTVKSDAALIPLTPSVVVNALECLGSGTRANTHV